MSPEGAPNTTRPLGELPDFDRIDRERRQALLAFEHKKLSEYPGTAHKVEMIDNEHGSFTTSHGLELGAKSFPEVRLIPSDTWEALLNSQQGDAPDSSAFYDTGTNICFIKFDEKAVESSQMAELKTIYAIAHEKGHQVFSNCLTFSFHLSEGLADFYAKKTFGHGVLSKVLSQQELQYPPTYIERAKSRHKNLVVGGFEISSDEMFVIFEGNKAIPSAYSRIPQLRLVTAMERSHPEEFSTLLKLASQDTNNAEAIHSFIAQHWGEKFADVLQQPHADIHRLIELIDQIEG